MQIWAEFGKSALPICNYSQILYQFLTFTQNLKRSPLIKFIHSIHIILQSVFAQCKFDIQKSIRQITRLPEKVSPPDRGGES